MKTNAFHLRFSQRVLGDFCRGHHIHRLAVFGSVLHGDARTDSDLDLLVEFEAGHVPGLFRLTGIELELSEILGGRKVDLNTALCLGPDFRSQVLAEAEPLYAAA